MFIRVGQGDLDPSICYFSMNDMAKALGVSRGTLQNWVKAGHVDCYKYMTKTMFHPSQEAKLAAFRDSGGRDRTKTIPMPRRGEA